MPLHTLAESIGKFQISDRKMSQAILCVCARAPVNTHFLSPRTEYFFFLIFTQLVAEAAQSLSAETQRPCLLLRLLTFLVLFS